MSRSMSAGQSQKSNHMLPRFPQFTPVLRCFEDLMELKVVEGFLHQRSGRRKTTRSLFKASKPCCFSFFFFLNLFVLQHRFIINNNNTDTISFPPFSSRFLRYNKQQSPLSFSPVSLFLCTLSLPPSLSLSFSLTVTHFLSLSGVLFLLLQDHCCVVCIPNRIN